MRLQVPVKAATGGTKQVRRFARPGRSWVGGRRAIVADSAAWRSEAG